MATDDTGIVLDADRAAAIDLPRPRPRPAWRARERAARVLASSRAREATLYGTAAVTYVTAGVFVTELALSWVVGIAWLLFWVCGVPRLVRCLRP